MLPMTRRAFTGGSAATAATFATDFESPIPGSEFSPSPTLADLIERYQTARIELDRAYDLAAAIPDDLSLGEHDRLYNELTDAPHDARWDTHHAIAAFQPETWPDFAAKAMALAGETDGDDLDPDAQILASLLEDVHRMTGLLPCAPKPTGQYSHDNWWPKGGAS